MSSIMIKRLYQNLDGLLEKAHQNIMHWSHWFDEKLSIENSQNYWREFLSKMKFCPHKIFPRYCSEDKVTKNWDMLPKIQWLWQYFIVTDPQSTTQKTSPEWVTIIIVIITTALLTVCEPLVTSYFIVVFFIYISWKNLKYYTRLCIIRSHY